MEPPVNTPTSRDSHSLQSSKEPLQTSSRVPASPLLFGTHTNKVMMMSSSGTSILITYDMPASTHRLLLLYSCNKTFDLGQKHVAQHDQ